VIPLTETSAPPPALPPTSGPWVRAGMLGASFSAAGVELAIMQASIRGAPLSSLILAHLATSAVLIIAAAILYRRGGRDPSFLLFVVATAAMGPLGALCAGLGAIVRALFACGATPFEEWYASLFPNVEPSPIRALYDRLVVRAAGPSTRSSVAPFLDVMALGTVKQKQAVITMIADEFQPIFAPALRDALSDSEPSIRVQAATASARIENQFLMRLMALEDRLARASGNPDILLAIARCHEEYANTGLLDPGRVENERRQALEYYGRVREIQPGNPHVAEAMGRILLFLNQPEQALTILEAEARRHEATASTIAMYLECLYRLHRFAAVRDLAREHWDRIAEAGLPSEVLEAANLWAGGTAEYTLEGGGVP
jgi:polysaccharide biosynthesis protein PelE